MLIILNALLISWAKPTSWVYACIKVEITLENCYTTTLQQVLVIVLEYYKIKQIEWYNKIKNKNKKEISPETVNDKLLIIFCCSFCCWYDDTLQCYEFCRFGPKFLFWVGKRFCCYCSANYSRGTHNWLKGFLFLQACMYVHVNMPASVNVFMAECVVAVSSAVAVYTFLLLPVHFISSHSILFAAEMLHHQCMAIVGV